MCVLFAVQAAGLRFNLLFRIGCSEATLQYFFNIFVHLSSQDNNIFSLSHREARNGAGSQHSYEKKAYFGEAGK